jgi:hypothetical protein
VEKDEEKYRAVIDAKGRDARSAGNAAAMITAELRPDGDSTVVTVDTDLKISGKLAQFGSGMIKEVSGKILGQFVVALEAKIAGGDQATATPAPTAESKPAAVVENAVNKPAEAAFETGRPPVPATVETAGPAAALRIGVPDEEPAPLDLMDLAGGSLRKRLLPLAAGVVVAIVAVIVWRRARG